MKVGVCNDIHSADFLLGEVLCGLQNLSSGDCLIINGDLASRGMITNPIVALYYKVKRDEADIMELIELLHKYDESIILGDLVEESIHSGTFLSELAYQSHPFKQIMEDEIQYNLKFMKIIGCFANLRGVTVYYLPGNGEVFPLDYDTSEGVDKELLVPEDQRVINRLQRSGVFGEYHVKYIDFPLIIRHRLALLPLNVIDSDDCLDVSESDSRHVTHVVVHYPPAADSMTEFFNRIFGYRPNALENHRRNVVSHRLNRFDNANHIYCGHIHTGADEQRSMALPVSATFEVDGRTVHWVKPGHLEIFTI